MLRHHRPHYKYPEHFKYPEHYKYPDHYKYPEIYKYPEHYGHYEDVDHLITELEQEKRHRDSIEWANTELERNVVELETYYRDLQEDRRDGEDNEWKVRFEQQGELNKQLGEQQSWLEAELVQVRRKLTTGSYPEANKYNLDSLNETELLRLVKHLERGRNGLYSSLRDLEWKMDKESKEFRHFDEIRRTCRAEIKGVNQAVERIQWGKVIGDPPGILSPLYNPPPGYLPPWMDTPPPLLMKGSHSLGRGKGRSRREEEWKERKVELSPSRAKSRVEKKGKKKEVTPPDERRGRRNANSETENGTDVYEVGKGESNPSSGADTYVKEAEAKRKSSKDATNNVD